MNGGHSQSSQWTCQSYLHQHQPAVSACPSHLPFPQPEAVLGKYRDILHYLLGITAWPVPTYLEATGSPKLDWAAPCRGQSDSAIEICSSYISKAAACLLGLTFHYSPPRLAEWAELSKTFYSYYFTESFQGATHWGESVRYQCWML